MRSSSGVRRPASRLSASLALSALLFAAQAIAAETHTVFAELKPPFRSNRAAFQQALKKERIEAHSEGEREVALVLTAAQIQSLFGARVTYRQVAKSSGPGMIEQPFLESPTIPARFAKYIRRVYFDPQRG
jgi:hypothetical protein